MSRSKKSHETYVKEIDNRPIVILEKYQGAHTKRKHRCLKCGNEWSVEPAHILQGSGCPRCNQYYSLNRTVTEYVDVMANDNIEVLTIDHWPREGVRHKCKECGHTWNATPHTALSCGCPNCNDRGRTHTEYVKELEDRPIKVIEEYEDSQTKILHLCEKCNYQWRARPNNIIHYKTGCPKCNKKISKGEKDVKLILDNKSIIYQREVAITGCENKRRLKFDFCITTSEIHKDVLNTDDIKKIIEVDGKQHFEPIEPMGGKDGFKKRKYRDKIKNNFCDENNIPLLRVSYKDRKEDNLEEKVVDFLD